MLGEPAISNIFLSATYPWTSGSNNATTFKGTGKDISLNQWNKICQEVPPKKLFPRLSEKVNFTSEYLDDDSFSPHSWFDFQTWFLKQTAHSIAIFICNLWNGCFLNNKVAIKKYELFFNNSLNFHWMLKDVYTITLVVEEKVRPIKRMDEWT